MEKRLAKITSAEFGSVSDYPFMFGLILNFGSDGWGVGCGGKYTLNISPECRWPEADRQAAMVKMIEKVHATLVAAKVDSVSQLRGKPVEITFDGHAFKDFRILTEVL